MFADASTLALFSVAVGAIDVCERQEYSSANQWMMYLVWHQDII